MQLRTTLPLVAALVLYLPMSAIAQGVRLRTDPEHVTARVGDRTPLSVTAVDDSGESITGTLRIFGGGEGVRVLDGEIEGLAVGAFELTAILQVEGAEPVRLQIPVIVDWPPVETVSVISASGALYDGTTVAHEVRATHANGTVRTTPTVEWSSSDHSIADVDRFGNVTAHNPGSVTITATVAGVDGNIRHRVTGFPGDRIELLGGPDGPIRTGDVVNFQAVILDTDGNPIPDVAVSWSHSYQAPEGLNAPAAPGQLIGGKFVADWPGVFTVYASAGPLRARHAFEAEARDVVQELEVSGHGLQNTLRTTDFWVFEGLDGRDYVITGSKVANGHAYVFDVTDPTNPIKTDSVQVDARAVNDVKVSPDGRYATMTREGASNRRNGLVILDLADPAHPVIASEYTDGMTGGVHNAFPTNTHVFALSNGDKYQILDVSDIYNPTYVSEYDHPDSRLHDVWVMDGLAYSAEWDTGIVVVDVGNGRWGGTIENPVLVTEFKLTGSTHALVPYYSESAGKVYLFAGDERMNRRGLAWAGYPRSMGSYQDRYDPETGTGGIPLATRGYIQVIDFSDPENPEWVARYEVSEFGTHNIWVEDDILYQAYYEGGVRMVDVSGELMGNLYTQGREIAVFKPASPIGYTSNATMVWSAMPFKGYVWFSDTNSGIWAVKLKPKQRPIS